MDQNTIAALVALIQTGGFIHVSCQTNQDPMIVEIDTPGGLSINLSYVVYEQIREAAGLPEGVCTDSSES